MKRLLCAFCILFTLNVQAQYSNILPFRQGDQWGYVNSKQRTIIEPEYDSASFFKNYYGLGILAKVYKKGKAGLIDRNGNFVVKPKYNTLVINQYMRQGREVFGGILVTDKKGKYGILNREFDYRVKPDYDTMFFQVLGSKTQSNEFTYFARKGDYHFKIDKTWKYQDATEQVVNRFIEKKRKKDAEKIKREIEITPEIANERKILSSKLNSFVKRNKGIIDAAQLNKDSHKIIEVSKNGKKGIVFSTQVDKAKIDHWILKPFAEKVLEIKAYYSGTPYLYVLKGKGKVLVIGDEENLIMEPMYEDYTKLDQEGIFLKEKNKHGYFRFKDGLLIKPKYDKIKKLAFDDVTFWEVWLNGKKGFLNKDGSELFSD